MKLTLSEQQQQEMRHAYYDGAPGILVSGLVWSSAAAVCHLLGIRQAVWTLLIGGVLIYPLSVVVTKVLRRPAKTDQGNALNQLVMASTVWLILCCAMAYGLFVFMPKLFFPAMLAAIGGRYLVFASIYARPVYWVMGATLIVAANGVLFLAIPPVVAAALGGLIEIVFAVLVFSNAARPAS
ncbi:hypothetical protein SAMN05192549_106108 [Duganella sacchari]|uniref:Integral membrane protein n=1 Tax=Duganella sacchari TaxID=551987 RepID=A0A1M7Q2N8_9BURK|nr:hypothetical protein [Duganella sacchari]SHN24431.1 hypothetical protein SAMN05192549_106108 [Duganella sacchari]